MGDVYRARDGKLMQVRSDGTVKVLDFGVAKGLTGDSMGWSVSVADYRESNTRNSYLPSRDGQRFLVNMLLDGNPSPINVAVNWTADTN